MAFGSSSISPQHSSNKIYSSKAKVTIGKKGTTTAPISRINGRPVLQHTYNQVSNLERRNSIKKVSLTSKTSEHEEKRCSFITTNYDPIYIAYHDEEWGVPVHDDKTAFSEFDVAIVANFNYKQIMTISLEHGIDISIVGGVVDNANRILEGFVNHKPTSTQYKFGQKIPVRTSKSESISKDMVRRGIRFVSPTVLHSFMQASGLINDHLITCHRHMQCTLLAY